MGRPRIEARAPSSALLALPGVVTLIIAAGLDLGRRPLWLDEAFTLGDLAQRADVIYSTDRAMAFYVRILGAWAGPASSPAWLRFPSLAAAAIALPFVTAVVRRVGGDRLAVAVALATGASPFVVRYAQEARSYTFALLLGAVSWWTLVRALEAGLSTEAGRRWMWGFAFALIGGQLAHGTVALLLPAQLAVAVTAAEPSLVARRFAPAALGTAALTGVGLTTGARAFNNWIPPLSRRELWSTAEALTAPQPLAAVVLVTLLSAGLVLWLRRVATASAADRWRPATLVAWAVVPPLALTLMSLSEPWLVPRYLIASAPALMALVVTPVMSGWRSATTRTVALGPALLAAVIVVALLAGQVGMRSQSTGDWRSAAALVAHRTETGDDLYFPYSGQRPPFEAAWRDFAAGAAPQPVNPGRPLGEVRLLEHFWTPARTRHALLSAHRVWVVSLAVSDGDAAATLEATVRAPVDRLFRTRVRRHFAGGVTVVLLERIPRSEA